MRREDMTSTISKRLRQCVDRKARSIGFVKHSTWLWVKPIEDRSLFLLLNLEKSNWGDEFYIELGAISGELPEKLQIWHSPLRIRIGSCVTDRRVLALSISIRRLTLMSRLGS